jgi:AraC family transcriptional regulator, positive regulator of tynA and feaB
MRHLQPEPAALEQTRFTTRGLPQSERLSDWGRAVESICGALHVDCDSDFEGRIDLRTIKNLVAARIIHNARSARRGRHGARSRDWRALHVIYQLSGRSSLRQGGREALLLAGEMAMLDSSQPCRLRFEGKNAQIWLQLSEQDLHTHGALVAPQLALTVTGAAATLIGTTMRTIFADPRAWTELQKVAIRASLLSLIAATWCDTEIHTAANNGRESVRPIVHIVQNYILTHLNSAQLAPESIARSHGLSVRHLHRLFKATGTSLAHWIRRCRLDRCAADLLDAALATERVTQIAFNWGFNDSAHFSRAFKQEFGQSPSVFRQDRQIRGSRADHECHRNPKNGAGSQAVR